MNRRRLLRRLLSGAHQNVAYDDFIALVEGFGFVPLRRVGSHAIFAHSDVVELVNVQNVAGEAKPYQIRQFLKLVERYNLHLEDAP